MPVGHVEEDGAENVSLVVVADMVVVAGFLDVHDQPAKGRIFRYATLQHAEGTIHLGRRAFAGLDDESDLERDTQHALLHHQAVRLGLVAIEHAERTLLLERPFARRRPQYLVPGETVGIARRQMPTLGPQALDQGLEGTLPDGALVR